MTETFLSMPRVGEQEYKEALASLNLSEKVHILGFTLEARYIAHTLAGTPELPPPQLLVRHLSVMDQWGEVGRQIAVAGANGAKGLLRSHKVLMPHCITTPRGANQSSPQPKLKHISNLIISTEESATLPSLKEIRDSIDSNTTICLINGGLGVVEHLNEVLFPDPNTRPTYVLGHMNHCIARTSARDSKHRRNMYAIDLKREGRLYLTGVPVENPVGLPAETWPTIANRARVQHMVKLLSSVPGLDAEGVPIHRFLRKKLPSVVFASVSDAISVAMGLSYEQIMTDVHANQLWGSLFHEAVQIIASLPELQEHPEVIDYFTGHQFLTETRALLARHSGDISKWIAMVRDGRSLPVNYTNGWFRRRAMETGSKSAAMRTIEALLRAKQMAKQRELKMNIPLYFSQSMMDSDMDADDGEPRQPVQLVYINSRR